MATKSNVVARLTVARADDTRTIVEIHADATFHGFYNFYQQQGRRYSTKRLVRTASRNEGLPAVNAHLHQPGLHVIAERLKAFGQQSNPVIKVTLRIIKKRAYKRLINAAPDALGLSKVNMVDMRHRQRILLPSNLVPARKRYSVLTGWSR